VGWGVKTFALRSQKGLPYGNARRFCIIGGVGEGGRAIRKTFLRQRSKRLDDETGLLFCAFPVLA